jgi:hypothetical protein
VTVWVPKDADSGPSSWMLISTESNTIASLLLVLVTHCLSMRLGVAVLPVTSS